MDKIVFILSLIAFSGLALIVGRFYLWHSFNRGVKQEKAYAVSTDKCNIDENLKKLKSNETYSEKARAFINLMQVAYVLVHTIVNEGNKYDDQIQSTRFCNSLTEQLINTVYNLEGKYE